MSCAFCHLPTKASDELNCYCCAKDLPCLTNKSTHHKDQDYGGMRDLDRGEWDNDGYFCDWCEARICAECAVDCEECDMWVCAKCAENKEAVLCNSCSN